MALPDRHRSNAVFPDRAAALGQFFERAGEAPRLLAYDADVGCPLGQALSTIEWTLAVGVLSSDDQLHAARLSSESAAAVVERRHEGRRTFVYIGPTMDAVPVDLSDGSVLYEQPGVRAFAFGHRASALGHFLRATQGSGAMLSLLSRRPPELRHIRRWLGEVVHSTETEPGPSLVAAWFATTGAGLLFAPAGPQGAFRYTEVGSAATTS